MQLPLFPLGSVLFPGMPLRLRIFEERYKEMINECLEQAKPFGVVLIKEGREALGPLALPYMVGTSAVISDVQRLPLGQMNILAIGTERFKINSLDRDSRSFLMGDVDFMSELNMEETGVEQNLTKLRKYIGRYLQALSKAGQIDFNDEQIPEDGLSLAYLAAILMQEDNEHKQRVLELESATNLVRNLVEYYGREVSLIDLLSSPPKHDDEHDLPFSLN